MRASAVASSPDDDAADDQLRRRRGGHGAADDLGIRGLRLELQADAETPLPSSNEPLDRRRPELADLAVERILVPRRLAQERRVVGGHGGDRLRPAASSAVRAATPWRGRSSLRRPPSRAISAVKLTPMVWIMLRVSQSAPPCRVGDARQRAGRAPEARDARDVVERVFVAGLQRLRPGRHTRRRCAIRDRSGRCWLPGAERRGR